MPRKKSFSEAEIRSAGGFGDSKPFIAEPGAFDELNSTRPHLSTWTVNGQSIPEEMLATFPYRLTDQGVEEFNKGKVSGRVEITRDPFSKGIEQFGDQRIEGRQPWETTDPLKEVADAHTPPGHRPRFLSPEKCRKDGLRGWQPVIVDGAPVKSGNMILASMPIEKAEQRNEHYRAQGAAALGAASQKFQQEHERVYRDAGLRPPRPSRQAAEPDDGFHSVRGNSADLAEEQIPA